MEALFARAGRVIIAAVAALAMVTLVVAAPACHHHAHDADITAHGASLSAAVFHHGGGSLSAHREQAVAAPAHCRLSSAEHEPAEAVEHGLILTAAFGDASDARLIHGGAPALAGRFDAAPRPAGSLLPTLGVMRI